MSWIRTYTGRRFNPFRLSEADYHVSDISHALSNLCRYNGHCSTFYSVAQHSVYVMDFVKERGFDQDVQLAALLHDASEAYLSDLPRPLKQHSRFYFYQEIEEEVQSAIYKKYLGEKYEFTEDVHDAIKFADMAVLAAEARDLMGNPSDWVLPAKAWERKILPVGPDSAWRLFNIRFQGLTMRDMPEGAPPSMRCAACCGHGLIATPEGELEVCPACSAAGVCPSCGGPRDALKRTGICDDCTPF